ncbi:RNA polymerase sigma factor [Pseudomonas sp. P9_31]|uniref:RNA polymerase sigma factor n=1 Tax=Pseudomonas sp. P9_31 TaxID=3043448 RepID=UPI002A358E27|nr:RNA polymerase sigma factor [Pseudomonas sp. P9_31]WPN55785.1 RNA polymerase sigma factor [Pseudomonas sp. P9_31]
MRKRCRQLTRSPQDAEDALSELRLHLFNLFRKEPERLTAIDNVQAWLRRVTSNLCIDRMRKTPATCSLEWLDHDLYESVTWQPLHYGPERTALVLETLEALNVAIERLPASLSKALELRCIDGAEYESMAGTLEISESNARKRVQLARQQLRVLLGTFGEDGEGF